MSWEIQGRVSGADAVDALVASPTEPPSDAEHSQVEAVGAALKALIGAGVVGGALYVRAGGHANPGGGPAEGAAHEMVTLTIDFDPTPEDPAAPAVDETDAEVAALVEAAGQGTDTAAPGA